MRVIWDLFDISELLDVVGDVRCFLSRQAHTWHLGMWLEKKERQLLRVEARRACDSRKRRHVRACALLTRGDHVTGRTPAFGEAPAVFRISQCDRRRNGYQVESNEGKLDTRGSRAHQRRHRRSRACLWSGSVESTNRVALPCIVPLWRWFRRDCLDLWPIA